MRLNIDKETHKLSKDNYYEVMSDKHQIVIGHSFSSGMNHIVGWKTRLNGKNKKTAAFTISLSGEIFQHYDPKYCSDFINIKGVNQFIIPIVLENEGWLIKDEENKRFLNWVGNIYNRDEDIVPRKWRSKNYWAPYSKEQLESSIKLVKYLCGEFNINQTSIGYNTKVDTIADYNGVAFRSNYSSELTDLSPAFNFAEFKNKLELN